MNSVLAAAMLACGVPLVGVVVCVVFWCLTAIGSNRDGATILSGLLAGIFGAATIISLLVVTIVYAIRWAKASECLRAFVGRRWAACLLGHIVLGTAMCIWAWRVMEAIASM